MKYKILLAPMAGVTDLPFRLICREFGAPFCFYEMMDANADFIIAMMDQILSVIDIDAFAFWEDMCYKHGPLISPEMVRQYMAPRYRRVCDFLRSKGVEHIGLDCDGQIDSLIPVWMDSGLDFLYPFEVQSGMDVLEVRRKFDETRRSASQAVPG